MCGHRPHKYFSGLLGPPWATLVSPTVSQNICVAFSLSLSLEVNVLKCIEILHETSKCLYQLLTYFECLSLRCCAFHHN